MKGMNDKEFFKKLTEGKRGGSLNARFVLSVIAIVICSLGLSYLICALLKIFIPFIDSIPYLIQLLIFSLAISLFASWIVTKFLFSPIQKLRDGMREVADGNFDIKLEVGGDSKELEELIAGFNMMVQELRSTEILQSDFVSNVSHEFKTPINAIEGYATLLQSYDGVDSIENEYIEKILFNTRRLSSLVSNVLLLSRIDNQSIQHQKNEFDISEQIREEILALETSWTEKNIEFDINLDDFVYYGYENLMRHVWSNLIGNAIKFSYNGGEIKISLYKESSYLVFSIEDHGPGISEEAKKHIFDKFYQEDTSHKGEGNGLGLALVSKIVNLSGGDISAENNIGGGCKFTVRLK